MREGQLGFIPLPDSMAAGEGAARSWERAEAAERGGGAFSQSPGRWGHGRAQQKQQSVMDRLGTLR